MSTRLPNTYHKIGDTWDRTQKYKLPPGTWTATSTARKSDGTVVQTFTCGLATLSSDPDGYTHALNTTASATATAAWPAATLVCDVVFTDASSTPVKRSASAFQIVASTFLPPVLDEYTNLDAIPGDLVALMRGEKGDPGDDSTVPGPPGDKGEPGDGVPAGGTTGQVLAKASDTDHDTEWVDQSGGGGGGAANLAYTASPTGGTVTSDAGTDAIIPLADGTNAGLMAPAQHTKLAGLPSSADEAGTAASAVSAHAGATDPHGDRAFATSAAATAQSNAISTASSDATTKANAAQAAAIAASTPAAHAGSGGSAHANAVAAGAAGFMTGSDKSKLDGIAAGAQVNPASTDAVPEGSTNLYHTAARVRSTVLTGLSTALGTVVTAAHTVLEAIGFLQKQVSDNTTAISGKQATLVSGTNIKTINSTSLLGSGDLTVSAAPGGGTTQVQVNSGGAFTGYSTFTCGASGDVTANRFIPGVAGTKTTPAYRVGTQAGFYCRGSAEVNLVAGNADFAEFNVSLGILMTTNSPQVGWTGSSMAGSANRTALQENASGVVEINNGTAGTYRDLKLRNLIANGNLATGIVAKNTAYTATTNDHTITVDASAFGAVTITGFACSGNAGKRLTIKKTDSSGNAVTFDPNASETVDGASTKATSTQYAGFTVQVNADGTGWAVVATF